MPKFNYVAMDSRGKETKGTLEVANQNEAIGRIKEMGFFPTKVVEDKGRTRPGPGQKRPRPKAAKRAASISIFKIKIPA
jgi:type II secretory pathway component PulF